MKFYFLIPIFLLMTFLGSYGCFALKLSTKSGLSIIGILKNRYFYLGGVSYFLSAILNIILLKYLKYAVILPLTSITYVWSMILAYYFLHEKISKEKIIGISLIITGIPFLLIN